MTPSESWSVAAATVGAFAAAYAVAHALVLAGGTAIRRVRAPRPVPTVAPAQAASPSDPPPAPLRPPAAGA
ncbi:hypothetical protein MXD62_16620 [Frankia sp. Mgl5]|uniref:hypothetical protein n=1 Tax=Frankia sp. Mgl5 TaxID=2933793 RepID=UPI00200C648E|nr:hypothetical protein [Frankia sp. Mgl5]MCK9928780.1 hypothetical protein [Frankia sp. Mgl5]